MDRLPHTGAVGVLLLAIKILSIFFSFTVKYLPEAHHMFLFQRSLGHKPSPSIGGQ